MSIKIQLLLKPTSILNVPLKKYEENFIFIVNGKKYKTNRVIADMLSPKICQLHFNDPLLDVFTINTQENGDFDLILDLINFEQREIQDKDIIFVSEIFEKLGNTSIEIENDYIDIPITIDNVISLIQNHENKENYYFNYLQAEIDFASSHFFEICNQKEELFNLKKSILERIIQNPKLQLSSENQLLSFVNDLYSKDPSYSTFYEFVHFSFVNTAKMAEFLTIFDINDITNSTWTQLSIRLRQEISKKEELSQRYHHKGIYIEFEEGKEFKGIIDYLRSNSENDIYEIIDITSSSIRKGNEELSPRNVILFDDKSKDFISDDKENSWIEFDFKNHTIIPKHYTIRSYNRPPSLHHPKSWIIEGSNDRENWDVVDEQRETASLNRRDHFHTFAIKNQNLSNYRFLRMRQTALNWIGNNQLCLGSVEFYGYLI